MSVHAKSLQLCPALCNVMDSSPPGSSVQEFSMQEHWSRLPCHPSGDLPDPGIKPAFLMSPVLAGRFFMPVPLGKPKRRTHNRLPHSQIYQNILENFRQNFLHYYERQHQLFVSRCRYTYTIQGFLEET